MLPAKRYSWLLVLFFLPGCIVHGQEANLETLTIETSAGEAIHYQVEVARSQRERARGLMFREFMPEDHGMLFLYYPEKAASMWMKNTIISLDMLFIDKQGRIVRIVSDTEPGSTKTISSGEKVRAVLELNAGQALRRGIEPGAQVLHPTFKISSNEN